MFVDLHIHSCLSPCADDDMTPANICGMAYIKGLEAIAVTDHNSAENLPYAAEAAKQYHLIMLPGIEITTKEEVHLLAYFNDVETALSFGRMLREHLPSLRNNPAYFGNQIIMDENDRIIGNEDKLLIGAADLSLKECTELIRSVNGAAVPAHINRGANGLLVNMGMLPEDPVFDTLEISKDIPVDSKVTVNRKILHSSDAHNLGNISEAVFDLPTKDHTLQALLDAIRNGFET